MTTEPMTTEPMTTEPMTTEPATTEPATTEPALPSPDVLPYGSWPSPISAADVARSEIRLSFPVLVEQGPGSVPDVWWTEGRPAEGGREVVVSAARGDVLPSPWNARTRVHEYGGACWLGVPPASGGRAALVFSEWTDQRLYLLEIDADADTPQAEPRPLTPVPAIEAGFRYADPVLSPDGTQIWCVRETHTGQSPAAVTRAIVGVPLDGSAADNPDAVHVIVAGSQFLAFPTPSPDGRRLAWIAWDHPNMPWDGTELRLADIDTNGAVRSWRTLLGGPTESVLEPVWADDDHLYCVSDRSGWWNLYRVAASGEGEPQAIAPRAEEFSGPLWQLGYRNYAKLDREGLDDEKLDGGGVGSKLAVVHGVGVQSLGVADPQTGTISDLDLPFTFWHPPIQAQGHYLAGVAGSATIPTSVVRVNLATGGYEVLRRAADDIPDTAYLPQPRSVTVSGPGGRDVHAHVYAPRNPRAVAPADERPPFVVFVHGGPTSDATPAFDLLIAYFTSRGIGVVDVEYGGSTGYGRAYRERLRGQWGVVDVEDCVAAAQALAKSGEADGARLAIRGGSAGGWTTLAALTRTDAFAAGTSYYGVAELVNFVNDTHDFESRYVDGLVGPLPQARDLYVERAPLSHVDEVSCPVLLLQGLEDEVVPPSQAEMFRDALVAKGIRHAYLTFEGEQHGFRKAETVIAALEAELSFYGQVFGFVPPGVPVLQLS